MKDRQMLTMDERILFEAGERSRILASKGSEK